MSEIARLRRLIELECEAMRLALDGFRATASHEIINHRYSSIGDVQEQLAALVGDNEAAHIMVEIYIHALG